MPDMSSNKQAVLEFYDLAFNKNKPAEAAERVAALVFGG
jgi:predicted SnoaL-like aldol condensation-catalyzing enzyme